MAEKSILIIGLGRFGHAMAESLWDTGAEVIVLDQQTEAVERVKERCSAAFVGEATDEDVLRGIGAADVDVAVVTFGEDFEATVLCAASLVSLGIDYVAARAATTRQTAVLKRVGVERVIQPETDTGRRLANELVSPVAEDLIEFSEGYQVLPWNANGELVGKTLAEAGLRQHYEITVIGYRPPGRHRGKPDLQVPNAHYRISEGDTLLIVGEEANVNRFLREIGG